MAKTISKRKSPSSRARAARLSRAVAATGDQTIVADELDELPDDENEDDVVGDEDDGSTDASASVEDDEDAELDNLALSDEELERTNSRAVAVSPRNAQAPAPSYQRGGIYVPEFLLANPITRWPAEAYIELRKAVWPTFTEARNMTLIVVTISALVALILGLADLGLTKLVTWLTGLAA